MKTKILTLVQALLIAAAGFWAHGPAVHGDWVWDDVPEIVQNPLMRDPAGLWKAWVAPATPDYFPLKTSVQWVQWRLWGTDTAGYHLTNLALHVLSALLFWRLLVGLRPDGRGGGTGRWEWLGGLLFAVHPLAVESVAWIAELKNTLSLPLLLLAMIGYVAFDRKRAGRGAYWLSLGCFVLAALAKSSVVMFPCVLLLFAWWRARRVERRDLLEAAPFFLAALVLGLVTIWFQQHRVIEGKNLHIGGLGARLEVAGAAIVAYLGRFLLPVDLMPAYPRWTAVSPWPVPLLPWFALAALAAWLWARRGGWGRDVLFGLGCFGLNLLPVLGLVPMAFLRISWVADHFAYLPMLGLCGLAAGGAGILADGLGRSRRWPRVLLAAAMAAVLALLAAASHRQAGIYRDNETFWQFALRGNPRAWIAHDSLAGFLAGRPGRQAEALAHYEEALRLRPDYAEGHSNLGLLLAGLPGRQAEALSHYETALRLSPDFVEAHNNLGNLLAGLPGREGEARTHLETALRLRPDYAEAHNNLAIVLAGLPGHRDEALAHYEEALRLQPDYATAHNNLGNLLAAIPGRREDALAHLGIALRLEPDHPEVHNNIGIILAGMPDRRSEALAQLEEAVRLAPGYADARANLAKLHYLMGRELGKSPSGRQEADAHFRAALAADPEFAPAREALGPGPFKPGPAREQAGKPRD